MCGASEPAKSVTSLYRPESSNSESGVGSVMNLATDFTSRKPNYITERLQNKVPDWFNVTALEDTRLCYTGCK